MGLHTSTRLSLLSRRNISCAGSRNPVEIIVLGNVPIGEVDEVRTWSAPERWRHASPHLGSSVVE